VLLKEKLKVLKTIYNGLLGKLPYQGIHCHRVFLFLSETLK